MPAYQKEDLLLPKSACQYSVLPSAQTVAPNDVPTLTVLRGMTRSVVLWVGVSGSASYNCSLLCQAAEWQLNEYTAFGIIIYKGNPRHSEMR